MSDMGTIGKYTLRRILGKGAMGVVYEAFDPMIERTVALKTIRKDLWEADDGDELRERFLREARAAGRLLHPGIVTVYEFGEDGGGAYIVMEHVSGRTLKEMIDGGKRFSVDEAVTLMTPVLAALGYSHKAGVVHRDIKPANVMVTGDGQVKILDFGVARLASANITQVGTILGTPAYMAPEQLMGQAVDSRADLYSAGVILRELLTGHKTFTGDYGQVLHQVLYGELDRPSAINSAVPAVFDDIVARAMARQPEDRFASAEEFSETLAQPARRPAPRPQVIRQSTPPQAGRSLALPLAAGAVLLLAAGAGAAWQFGAFGGSQPPPAAAVAVRSPEPVKPAAVPEPVKPAAAPEPVTPTAAPEPVKPAAVPEPVKPAAVPEPVTPAAAPEPAQVPADVLDSLSRPQTEPPKPAVPQEPALKPEDVVALLATPEPQPKPVPVVKPKPAALTVVTDRGAAPRYKVGETMQVMVSIERQADVYCFYQSAGGEIVRVFPTRFAPDATLKARQLLKLPGSQPFSFQFDRGGNVREEVRCLGVDPAVAVRLPAWFGGGGFEPIRVASLNALVEAVRSAAGEDIAVGSVVATVD